MPRPSLHAAIAAAATLLAAPASAQDAPRWSFAIHGGAGVIERDSLSPEQDAAYRASLTRALEAGSKILSEGGSGLDAAGRNELDAAVMNGADRSAGAVAGLTRVRHPIAAARAVMEKSPHVMLIGDGADAFAASVGLERVPPSFFFTERRWQGLSTALRAQNLPIPPRPEGIQEPPPNGGSAEIAPPLNEKKFGTVGAVALDTAGDLVAGTSTGGMTAKRWGRVGDVPVIGAGTYASNAEGCAVSATGSGEYFIRATVARDICARIANGASVQAAADAEIADVASIGGDGGVIVMGKDGAVAFALNTSGMYRGVMVDGRFPYVAIHADEK